MKKSRGCQKSLSFIFRQAQDDYKMVFSLSH